jgi:hypothetical protein
MSISVLELDIVSRKKKKHRIRIYMIVYTSDYDIVKAVQKAAGNIGMTLLK